MKVMYLTQEEKKRVAEELIPVDMQHSYNEQAEFSGSFEMYLDRRDDIVEIDGDYYYVSDVESL